MQLYTFRNYSSKYKDKIVSAFIGKFAACSKYICSKFISLFMRKWKRERKWKIYNPISRQPSNLMSLGWVGLADGVLDAKKKPNGKRQESLPQL